MRLPCLLLPLLLVGCATRPSAQVARYNIWRADTVSDTFAYRVAPETEDPVAVLVRESMSPAGLYESSGDTAIEITARLDVGPPRMTAVSRWSPDWTTASEERRFVEIMDRNGNTRIVHASHPDVGPASRCAVLFCRSTLFVEARLRGDTLWCAEIVVIAPEDTPERIAPLLNPALVEVLRVNSIQTASL